MMHGLDADDIAELVTELAPEEQLAYEYVLAWVQMNGLPMDQMMDFRQPFGELHRLVNASTEGDLARLVPCELSSGWMAVTGAMLLGYGTTWGPAWGSPPHSSTSQTPGEAEEHERGTFQ